MGGCRRGKRQRHGGDSGGGKKMLLEGGGHDVVVRLLLNDHLECAGNILKKVFRKDGPPLGLKFDPLPPLAFCNFISKDVQEVRQDHVTYLQQNWQSQPQPRRSNHYTSFVGDASCTAEKVRSRKSQKTVMLAAASGQMKKKRSRAEQETDTNGLRKKEADTNVPLKGSKKLKLKPIKFKFVYLNASSSAGGGNGEGTLPELTSPVRIERDASFIAGLQDQGTQEASLPHEPAQAQEKTRELCNQNSTMLDAPSTPERNGPEAPVLADFQEAKQVQESNQPQPSPSNSEAERQKDQTDIIEDASSIPEGREIREEMVHKLTSSEKNELQDSLLLETSLCDSACNEEAPIAQMISGFHDPAGSCSLTSSTLNWASTFDDVSSSGAGCWGTDKTMVNVGNYFVDQKHSATMDAIIKKFGDIAKDCRYKSTMFRSFAVRGVCEVFMGLQIPLQQLSHDRLNKYSCFVKEVALMGLTVEWLKERLSEVSETINCLKECKHIRDKRKQNMEKVEHLKGKIGLMEIEKRKGENEVEELKCMFEAAKLEVRKKKNAINEIKSRCKAIPKRLLDGLY